MPLKNIENDFQKQAEEIVKKSHSKKVYFVVAIIFTAIAIGLIVGIFVIINNHEYLKNNKNEANNEIIKPINQKTKKYYDALEKKCKTNCCLSSLKIMRENNYKEADENRKCPEGFEMNSLWCETALKWCVPMEEENLKILLEPKNIAQFNKQTIDINSECVSHPQIVSYLFSDSAMRINSGKLEENHEAIENIVKFVKEGEIPKKIIKVSKPSGVMGEKNQIVEEERQDIGYLYYDAFHNDCGGFMINFVDEIENIFYPGADDARAVYVWEGQDIPGIIKVKVYAYYEDYVIELSKPVLDEDYLMNIVKKCEKSFEEQCFSETIASDKMLKQKAKETADELVELFALNNKQITSDWQTYRNEEFGFEVKYPEDWYWEDYTEEFKHSMIGFYSQNKERGWDYVGDIQIQKIEKNIEENLMAYFENMFRDMTYMHDKAISKKNKHQKDTILIYDVPGYINADEILVDCDNFVILFNTPFGVATDIMKQMADELLCL